MTSRVVGKQKRTSRSLAGLNVRKVLRAYKLRKGLADRDQEGPGGWPPTIHLKLERPVLAARVGGDPVEDLIALKKPI
jgi:hypothetical protein